MNEIKVFQKGACLSIDGINFIHHPNGGGLKAVTAKVDANVYLGPGVVVKDKAKISGKEIKITGTVEIKPNVEISGKEISIFGYGRLSITKSFKKTDIDIHGKGRWLEV
jgi:NDP-sugar pyrophosphorylase family protein